MASSVVTGLKFTQFLFFFTLSKRCYEPLVAAEAGWKEKFDLYSGNYDASASVFQPIVLEVYGGWAQKTYEFLSSQIKAIAGGDAQLFSRLWKDLRDRMAVALVRGQGEVIQHYNFRNGTLIDGET